MLGCPAPLGCVCFVVGCPVHHDLGWRLVPVRLIALDALVWPDHDIDEAHLGPEPHERDGEPIYVEALRGAPGRYFVHDGRHRAIRARRGGLSSILARVLE